MKAHHTLALFALVAVIGCGETPVASDKSDKQQQTSTSVGPELYFKAWGNEPGWNLQMMSTEKGTFPVELVLDYGADTLRGTLSKLPIMEQKGEDKGQPTVGTNEVKYTGQLEGDDGRATMQVTIVSGICTDDGDKQHGTSVTITLTDQVLRGCGDYFE